MLLCAGVAAMIAAAHDVGEVILAENGIMAINCPRQAGDFSTHTAHPEILSIMSELSHLSSAMT